MKIVFRTDSSIKMGAGHLMRCFTLADELNKQNHQITFICRNLTGNLISLLEKKKYKVIIIPVVHNFTTNNIYLEWLGATQKYDAEQTIRVLPKNVDLLIIDSYALDEIWHQRLRKFTKKIMVIDDLADRSFDCDILLNQNLGAQIKKYKGRVSNLDIFSTVASVAGVDMTRNDLKDIAFDGANLIPYLSGENEGEPERILFNKSGDYSFLIKEGWKLQVDLVQNKKWLYNLNEDPTEQLNLSESNFTKLNELEEILNNKLSEQVKPIWPSLLDWPIFIDKTLDDKVNKNDEYIFWAN